MSDKPLSELVPGTTYVIRRPIIKRHDILQDPKVILIHKVLGGMYNGTDARQVIFSAPTSRNPKETWTMPYYVVNQARLGA